MSYSDRTLTCVDCSVEFIHSAADQEFYAEKGFVSDPKRCPSCRAARRAMRESSGYDSRDIGGPRGYERGEYRTPREYFAVICSRCGNAAQVPFKPRMDKPVYCSDCFRAVQAEGDDGSDSAAADTPSVGDAEGAGASAEGAEASAEGAGASAGSAENA